MKYSRLRKLPVLWVYRALVSKKCVFHSTSELETAFIKEQFKQPVQIVEIPNYIELPRAVLREPQEYLLFIGRITPKKAIENLIEALSLSKKFRDSGLKLKIAGRGAAGYIKELKEIAIRYKLSEKIEFIGQVEGEQKQELYSNAFWTIMPSHTENFGMVVLESLAQSTPVIASKHSPWQSLETAKTGIWTENSPRDLAIAIDAVIEMPAGEYNCYRERARPFVEKNYDIKTNIRTWNEFYRSFSETRADDRQARTQMEKGRRS